MNNIDKKYQELLQDILDNGTTKSDRTGVGTKSVFGRTIRHKMSEGFPLLTTKKMFTKGIISELIWFLRGDTDIRYLWENNVHIWDLNWYQKYFNSCPIVDGYSTAHTLEQMIEFGLGKGNRTEGTRIGGWYFSDEVWDCGSIYGHQWRKWNSKTDDELYQEYLDKVI